MVATGPLFVAAGTLLGVAAIVASAVYDYSLQVPHIGAHGRDGALHRQLHPPRAARDPRPARPRRGAGRSRLLLTNAVLVTWLVAMWGGRIKLTTSPSA